MPRFFFRWNGDTAYAHACLGRVYLAVLFFRTWMPEIWTPGIRWSGHHEITLSIGPLMFVWARFEREA